MNSVDRAIHHVFGLTVTGGVGSELVPAVLLAEEAERAGYWG